MEEEEIGGDHIPVAVWFIDANITAHWIMGNGGILELLISKYDLSKEFHDIYSDRYESSISFIEKILTKKENGFNDEFYLSAMSLNELFSAVRDEVRGVIFFKNGEPISKWRDPRNIPDIKENDFNDIYSTILKSFDQLFENQAILPINDMSPFEEEKAYFEVFSSLLFLIKQMKTQDAILLTTAVFNGADYFVTLDNTLMKSAKKRLINEYDLEIISAKTALNKLR